MFPPDTAQWKEITEWSNISTRVFSGQHGDISFVTRKVCDGKIADDFKHVSYHYSRYFKLNTSEIFW